MRVNRVVRGGGGQGVGLGMRETQDLVWRAGSTLAVAQAAVCDRVLHAGPLGGGAVLVDQGRRRLVLCRGGVEGIMGGLGIGIGAMERVVRMNGFGVASGCSPTLGSGCTLGSAGGGVLGARGPV